MVDLSMLPSVGQKEWGVPLRQALLALNEGKQDAADLAADVAALAAPGSGSQLETTLNATYASSRGAGVARFLRRAAAGASLKIVALGDSILEGNTGTTPGTNDALTLARNALDSRFPEATFTSVNRAVSGYTVATSQINGKVAQAVTDKGDLYVVGFGRNDVVADGYSTPVQGYPLEQSMRGLEVILREVRRKVPQADIVVISGVPASVYATDGAMRTYQATARSVAAAYGAEWIDTYGAFAALGDYSAYLHDTVHPNALGHELIADTILASMPEEPPRSSLAPGAPPNRAGLRSVGDVDVDTGYTGWRVVQAVGAQQNGSWINSGTWTGPNPYSTTTAGDFAEFRFVGTEFMARLSTAAADAAVVDVTVDGVLVWNDLALSTLPSNFQPWVLLGKALTAGRHTVRITLVSGTLKVYQAAWLSAVISTPAAPMLRRFISGRYYGCETYSPASLTQTAGWCYVVPFFAPVAKSFDQLAVDVTTAAAGAMIHLGIYGADELDQPFGREVDAGSVDASTTGFKTAALSGVALEPGWHWLAALTLGGTPALRVSLASHPLVTSSAASTANAFNGYVATGVTSLPTVWTATLAVGAAPRILIRAT